MAESLRAENDPDEPREPPARPPATPPPSSPPSTSAPIPPPPWRTGTIRALEGDEILGLAFYGEQARKSVGVQLAGGALAALDELVAVLAAAKYGQLGRRGPAIVPPGMGALRLVNVAFGSAAFYFTSGEGEAFRIPVAPEEPPTRIADVADEVVTLAEARGSDEILEVARRYSDRVAAKYVQFLEVVVAQRVDTELATPRRRAELPSFDAGAALAALEQTDHIRVEELTAEGVLYEANARTLGFRLIQDDGLIIQGRFEQKLFVDIGEAWNHRVRAGILVHIERLARSGDERRTFELTTLQILGPAS